MKSITRRDFTRAAAMIGVSAAVASASAQTKPTDRIRLGFIGVGNRGDQVLDAFLKHKDAEIVAISDIYAPYLDHAVKKSGNSEVGQYTDYRRLLDRKDIDAVVINTPDHWHALQMIHACQAGKDVYVEKPLSLCVAEGRAMVNAANHYKRVTQVGLQRRSSTACQEMVAFLREGGIGKITTARAFHIQNEWPKGIGHTQDSAPPDDFDWDKWLGPAPQRPYNKNRALYRFRWFYDYSGGQLTNTGAHYLDLIQWSLGHRAPRSVVAMGGKFADFDNREVPDTLEAMWTYTDDAAGSTLVTFSQYNSSSAGAAAKPCELEFRGTKGTLYFSGGGYEVVPEPIKSGAYPVLNPLDRSVAKKWREAKPVIEPRQGRGRESEAIIAHTRNFLDCIRTRKSCNCDIETGHRSTSATLIANIAHKTRSLLDWDAERERFTNSEAANKLLSYEYRQPYELPAIG